DALVDALKKRQLDALPLLNNAIALDDKRKHTQHELDELLAKSNELSKKIGELFKSGKQQEGNSLREETSGMKDQIAELKDQMNATEEELKHALFQIPNVPHSSVPAGTNETDNVEVSMHGTLPDLPESALPHWELADKFNLIDFELGVKITGAGFPVYKGKGARLQRALINFFLDEADKAGYTEYLPPLLVNEASGIGTGQLPDKEGQMYHVTEDQLYLIPTGEVPLTNVFRDVILRKEDFPVKLCGFTPCFRREAGSYGKDVRGLNRLHQFDKVEIVQIQHPDKSYETLDSMVSHVQLLLDKLGLSHRILRLCGGDLGFAAALTFDFEVYSGAQKRWLEVSSVSNFETFQTNRLKCRFKNAEGKNQLAHSLNGSALALPRILACLLENNQTENGEIMIPEVLIPYCGFDRIG
ncbi:MAG: serine--tRNA ligase, partial [Flavobacteriales bacterium]